MTKSVCVHASQRGPLFGPDAAGLIAEPDLIYTNAVVISLIRIVQTSYMQNQMVSR